MTPRHYQKRAIAFLCKSQRAIIQAPAGSGKTFMACYALNECLKRRTKSEKARVAILCNTQDQVAQWEETLANFDGIRDRADIVVGCAAGNINTDVNLLIVDECHRAAAPTWAKKINRARHARWALSATPFCEDDERNKILVDLFGREMHTIERDQLVEDGHLTKAQVNWLDASSQGINQRIGSLADELIMKRRKKVPYLFRSAEGERKQINQCRWQAAQQVGLWDNDSRDYAIIREANKRIQDGHSVIVLIGKIEHGERLHPAISESVLCFSKMGAKRRREAIEQFRTGKIRCLIGTSMLDEGFDAPIADCLIIASAGKSFRKSVQSTGRVLRPHDGKDAGIVVDFIDSFNSMLSRQAAQRKKIYKDLKYSQKRIDS